MRDKHANDFKSFKMESKHEVVGKQPSDNPSRKPRGRPPKPKSDHPPKLKSEKPAAKAGRYARTDADRQLLRQIGQRIRWAREVLGLTRPQLAEMIGVDVGTWAWYEQGKRFPDLMRIPDICGRLKVDTEYLIRGSLLGVEKEVAIRLAARHPELVDIARTAWDKPNNSKS